MRTKNPAHIRRQTITPTVIDQRSHVTGEVAVQVVAGMDRATARARVGVAAEAPRRKERPIEGVEVEIGITTNEENEPGVGHEKEDTPEAGAEGGEEVGVAAEVIHTREDEAEAGARNGEEMIHVEEVGVAAEVEATLVTERGTKDKGHGKPLCSACTMICDTTTGALQ